VGGSFWPRFQAEPVQGLHDNLPPKHQPATTASNHLAPPERTPTQLFPPQAEDDDAEGYMARSQREMMAELAELERQFPGELAELVVGVAQEEEVVVVESGAGRKRKRGPGEAPAPKRSLEELLFQELDLDLGPVPFDVPTAAMFPEKVRVWR
jgi:hypothetical protein